MGETVMPERKSIRVAARTDGMVTLEVGGRFGGETRMTRADVRWLIRALNRELKAALPIKEMADAIEDVRAGRIHSLESIDAELAESAAGANKRA